MNRIRGPKKGAAARGIDTKPTGRPNGSKDRRGHARRVDSDLHRQRQMAFAASIAETLDRVLRERDIAPDELAAALGMHRHTVGHHVAGRQTPGIWTLLAYAEALGCLLSDLIPERDTA